MAAAPSPFFEAWREPLEQAARQGPIADLACGRGRHALACARLGLRVFALDRSRTFLDELAASLPADARSRTALSRVQCDFETDDGLPLRAGSCGAVLVFRYLHRPLANAIAELLAPGGLLLFETFTREQRRFGTGPRRDEFLLEAGELPGLFPGLSVLAFDEGLRGDPPSEATARLAARRER